MLPSIPADKANHALYGALAFNAVYPFSDALTGLAIVAALAWRRKPRTGPSTAAPKRKARPRPTASRLSTASPPSPVVCSVSSP